MESINGPTFVSHGVLVLWGDQYIFNGVVIFEVGLYTIPTADLFDALTKNIGVGFDYMTLCFSFIGSWLGACAALTFSPITSLTSGFGKPFLHPVQGPCGVFTAGESLA